MADRYGSTRWYNYFVPDTNEHYLIDATDPSNHIELKDKPRSGYIVGKFPGFEKADADVAFHKAEIDKVMRPASSYSSASTERFDPREGAPIPTTGPPRGPSGGPSAAAPPPQASGPQPARTSAPPPFPGASPSFNFPPPPSYSMPAQAPAAAAAAGPTLLQRVEQFFSMLDTPANAIAASRLFKPYIQQIRQAISTGQLDVRHLRPAALKVSLKFHPDKGGDEEAFKAVSELLGADTGIGLVGSAKPRRTRYVM